jgi:plastocyanin
MKARLLGMILVGMALAACSGGDDPAAPADAAGGSNDTAAATISMSDFAFDPADPTVSAGEVELVNTGEAPHNLTIDGEDVDVDVDVGETVTETLDLAPGTYDIYCEFHRSQGMEGTLTIEG